MAIQAVIFDLGGVLFSYRDGEHLEVRWERRLGLAPGAFQAAVWDLAAARGGEIGRTPESVWWAEAMEALGIDEASAAELYEDTWSITYMDERVEAYLRTLRPAFKVATLSNAYSDARRQCLARYPLDRLVDLMVFSAEEGVAKPDPRIYELTLDRLGIEPGRALFVDDRLENLEGAAAVGMWTVHVTSADQLLDQVPEALSGPEDV